jgi:hypothetical protein
VTPQPAAAAPTVAPSAIPRESRGAASPSPQPSPTRSLAPARVPVDIDIAANPEAFFAHELKVTWCAPAGVQMALALLGLGDTSTAFQRELQGRVREWESYRDSHNGKWGPSAMALALAAYGAPGYEVRGYKTRADALRDTAVAIETTRSPAILLAWRGAHTWLMTGYRSDADPRLFPDAIVEGAYILDPWYPSVSSIWGPSDPPGTFQDAAEMVRNYLRWKRPEGRYPGRDGLFIAVVPTVTRTAARSTAGGDLLGFDQAKQFGAVAEMVVEDLARRIEQRIDLGIGHVIVNGGPGAFWNDDASAAEHRELLRDG